MVAWSQLVESAGEVQPNLELERAVGGTDCSSEYLAYQLDISTIERVHRLSWPGQK